jgi:hypothetical protein
VWWAVSAEQAREAARAWFDNTVKTHPEGYPDDYVIERIRATPFLVLDSREWIEDRNDTSDAAEKLTGMLVSAQTLLTKEDEGGAREAFLSNTTDIDGSSLPEGKGKMVVWALIDRTHESADSMIEACQAAIDGLKHHTGKE